MVTTAAVLALVAIPSALTYVLTVKAKDREWGRYMDAVNQSWHDAHESLKKLAQRGVRCNDNSPQGLG